MSEVLEAFEDFKQAVYEHRGVDEVQNGIVLVKIFKNEKCMEMKVNPNESSSEVARYQAASRTGHLAFYGLLTGEAKDHGDYFSAPCYFSWDDRLSAEPEFVYKLALELLESKDKAGRRSWPRLC
jgi:hypothetical protein